MITCDQIIQNLLKHLANGFVCSFDGSFTVLTTPFMYADGDYIDLYLEQLNDMVIVSDMGETARRLAQLDFNWKTKQARRIFAHILGSTGVSSYEGKIYTKIIYFEDIGDSVSDLIQAIQQTDNLAFTVHDYYPNDFRDDVELYLRKSGFSPDLNYQIDGYSGTLWRIHFYFNHNNNVLAKALSSNSKGGAKNLVESTYAAYEDIKKLHPNVVRSLIIDNTKDIWEPETINLANQILDTNIGLWTEKEKYIDQLHSIII